MKQITVEGAYLRAAALCSRSEHAASDILAKLQTWGLNSTDARGIIERLEAENFIDERRFAHAFAHDKHLYNGWGRIKIAYQLRMKGIGQEAIDLALDDIDPDAYRDTMERSLRAKWREVQHREPQNARAAMLRFATSRGYELNLVYPLLSQITHLPTDDD